MNVTSPTWLEGGMSWGAWREFRALWLPALGPVGFMLLVELIEGAQTGERPNQTMLAARLGISRSTVQREIGRLMTDGVLGWACTPRTRGRPGVQLGVAGVPGMRHIDAVSDPESVTLTQAIQPGMRQIDAGGQDADPESVRLTQKRLPKKRQNATHVASDCATLGSFPPTPPLSVKTRNRRRARHARGCNGDGSLPLPDPAGQPGTLGVASLSDSDLPGHDPYGVTASVAELVARRFDGKANHGRFTARQAQALVAEYGERAVWDQMCWLESLGPETLAQAKSLAGVLLHMLADGVLLADGNPGPLGTAGARPEAQGPNPYAHFNQVVNGEIVPPTRGKP